MSQSIVIACVDCKVFHGIGQSTHSPTIPQPRMLHRQKQDIDILERFLFAHEGHELRIGDVSDFAYDDFE